MLGLALARGSPSAIAASVVAFYASARGLQDGDAVPVIAVTGTAANIAGVAGGIIVFGDPLPSDALGIVIQAVAFVMVIAASALMPAPVRSASVAPPSASAPPATGAIPGPRGPVSAPRGPSPRAARLRLRAATRRPSGPGLVAKLRRSV